MDIDQDIYTEKKTGDLYVVTGEGTDVISGDTIIIYLRGRKRYLCEKKEFIKRFEPFVLKYPLPIPPVKVESEDGVITNFNYTSTTVDDTMEG